MAGKARVTIDEIHLLYPSSESITEEELDLLRKELGGELPRGYREFLTRFGHGWINDWLQIYCPDRALLLEQRESLVRRFGENTREGMIDYDGPKLDESDIGASVQIGIDQDTRQLFACPRFPGSVFEWTDLTIRQHAVGLEVLDPFAAMRMDRFAYMVPLKPSPKHRCVACRSKKLEVQEVVRAVQERCAGAVRVIDVDEGPPRGSRSPAFWLFPDKMGVMFWVYLVHTEKTRNIYLRSATSPENLSTIDALIEDVSNAVGVKFRPAEPY